MSDAFHDLPGQDAVVGQLRQAAAGAAAILAGERPEPGAMTHAWLFAGPPGSGRSVAARAFAAALLCPSGGCGGCATCLQVHAGTHADLMLVRPAGAVLRGEADPGPGAARRGQADRGTLAGGPVRGRRPVHRTGRQRAAQGDRGARAADRLAAVRARGAGYGAHDQVPVPGGHAGRAVVGRGRPGAGRAGRHRARPGRWPRPARRRGTSAGPAAWPPTRRRPSAGPTCCGSRLR